MLAQQLWGFRPHCDVSVAMETAGAEEGLRLKTREGRETEERRMKRVTRGEHSVTCAVQAPSLQRHGPKDPSRGRVRE